ncbi:MAG: helix-turn-helix transcriptional regulator [Clostridia bacterium]|jgi:plasmid maintenance system antidote protein VapI|nr:helix-turn-helix transcriptional regulator [Clostridia bacterium]
MQEKLKRLMEAYHIDFGQLAEKLNISKQTLTRKINGSTDWTYHEIILLTQLFDIQSPQDFFFDIK